MHCLTCRHPLAETDRRCPYCGAPAQPPPWRRYATVGAFAVLAVVFVVAVGNMFAAARDHGDAVSRHRAEARVGTSTTVAAAPSAVRTVVPTSSTVPAPVMISPTQVLASSQAVPGRDGCGQAIDYGANLTLDGNLATAWRTKGDGSGQTLQFTLPSPTRVLQVGLVPGYAKVDACNNADRFMQYRRILSVRWTFDGQNPLDQNLAEKPAMQLANVDVTATRVSIEILKVTQGPQLDWTAISDVQFAGVPA